MASKTATVPKKRIRMPSSAFDLLQEQSRNFLASSFVMGSDEDRGIVTVVYKCSNCGDTDTERLFADKPIPKALCCVKCGAGFKINEREFGVTDHPAMWPTHRSNDSSQ